MEFLGGYLNKGWRVLPVRPWVFLYLPADESWGTLSDSRMALVNCEPRQSRASIRCTVSAGAGWTRRVRGDARRPVLPYASPGSVSGFITSPTLPTALLRGKRLQAGSSFSPDAAGPRLPAGRVDVEGDTFWGQILLLTDPVVGRPFAVPIGLAPFRQLIPTFTFCDLSGLVKVLHLEIRVVQTGIRSAIVVALNFRGVKFLTIGL